MRILADENFLGLAVDALRERGHDVLWARTDLSGMADTRLFEIAAADQRLLTTFDKDFGELVFRQGMPTPAGVVLFRIKMPSPSQAAHRIVSVLCGRTDWCGHFSLVDDYRIRLVPLLRARP